MRDPRVERIEALLERYSEGDLDAIDELVAPEFFVHVPADDEPTATEIFRGYAEQFKAAAPDLAIRIDDLAATPDGDLAGEAVVGGTWTGELWGVPPTGERLEFRIPLRVRSKGDRYAFTDANLKIGRINESGEAIPVEGGLTFDVQPVANATTNNSSSWCFPSITRLDAGSRGG